MLDGDLAEALERIDDDEPPATQDRDPVCDLLDLRERVRGEENRPSLPGDLAEERVEAALHQRIEPRDRLVQDQQLRLVHERLHQPELLPVSRRELADPPAELGVEAVCQRLADSFVSAAAERREVVQHRRPGHIG